MDDKLFCFEFWFNEFDDFVYVCVLDDDMDFVGFVVI